MGESAGLWSQAPAAHRSARLRALGICRDSSEEYTVPNRRRGIPHPHMWQHHHEARPRLTPQTIDAALVASIKKVDNLSKYLKASWGLSRGDRFHELKF